MTISTASDRVRVSNVVNKDFFLKLWSISKVYLKFCSYSGSGQPGLEKKLFPDVE